MQDRDGAGVPEPLTYEERKGVHKSIAAAHRRVEQAERDRARRELEALAMARSIVERWASDPEAPRATASARKAMLELEAVLRPGQGPRA